MNQTCKHNMKKGKNEYGWKKGSKNGRNIRERAYGLEGQEIWYRLQSLGFVHKGQDATFHETHIGKEKLSIWEQKLKNWLIWGYWEKDR